MNVIRLIEAGKLGFNDTLSSRVDDLLYKINGTSVLEIWGGRKQIERVTLWQLLHMSSGMVDKDTLNWKLQYIEHPNHDPTPIDELYALNKTFICEPGDCVYYSGINYILLGFVLAQHAGVSNWNELN